ncbi:MAG: hypothetical protein IKM20_07385 [Erysipelotrichales bacterium]|nr:hypothetical protein [Erysipelotrichales bacterium]
MIDDYIRNLDFNTAKSFLRKYNIDATDEEIRYLLPILKKNPEVIYNKQKRSAILQTLPTNIRNKIQTNLNKYSI